MPNVPTLKRADVSRIPLEILTEIFVHCLPADSASHETQQLLSGVCRLWRTLVLATPALWASLNIICDVDVPRPPLSVIHTHLQRSRNHPLSLNIYAQSHIRSHSHVLAVLTALAAVRQRWRKVYIDSARMTQDILDLVTLGEAPLLESLCATSYHCP
ncbi:hypothetical protein BD779DRAFT_1145458 [Infundibulicybe gibba]|nr:hypothetical protein BD779DRAFT_1145458 [Infundibulicybe gibba]